MSPKRLFLKKGFRETTTRDIAREAGINLSNLYHYFASKDELFRQLLKPATDTLEAMLNEHHHIAPGGADVEENCRLAEIIATGFHFLSVYSQREILETAHIGQFLTVDSIVDSIRGAVSPSRRAASAGSLLRGLHPSPAPSGPFVRKPRDGRMSDLPTPGPGLCSCGRAYGQPVVLGLHPCREQLLQ